MSEIHQSRKLQVMARPGGEDSVEALPRIRRDTGRAYAEEPFNLANQQK